MGQVVEGLEIKDEVADLLKATNSINAAGEYWQWLHLWTISTERAVANEGEGHIHSHTVLPWVRLWEKPDLSLIMATYYMTDFVNLPASWRTLWYDIDRMIEERRDAHQGYQRAFEQPPTQPAVFGPYWMLLPTPGSARLASEMRDMKRRIMRDIFNQYPREVSESDTRFIRSTARDEFLRALEPFSVLSSQQELEDETVRTAEERSGSIRVWNRSPPGRPPRCR